MNIDTDLLVGILGALGLCAGPVLGWWFARRAARQAEDRTRAEYELRMSGQIHTTEASRLWDAQERFRTELQGQILAQARNHREDLDRLEGELKGCEERHKHADAQIAQLQKDGREKDNQIRFQDRVIKRLEDQVKSMGQTLLAYQHQFGALGAVPVTTIDGEPA